MIQRIYMQRVSMTLVRVFVAYVVRQILGSCGPDARYAARLNVPLGDAPSGVHGDALDVRRSSGAEEEAPGVHMLRAPYQLRLRRPSCGTS